MTEIIGRQTVSGIASGAFAAGAVQKVRGAEGLRSSGTRRGPGSDLEKIELEAAKVVQSERTMPAKESRREAQRVRADALGHLPLSDAGRAIAAEAAAVVRRARSAEQSESAETLADRRAEQQSAARAYTETAESVERRG